jgi:Protein of unknown function (DUF3455)
MMNKFIFSVALFLLICHRTVMAETILPDALKVPDGNNLQLTLHAKGDQVFHCVLKAGEYSWKWHAPEAKLYDTQNQTEVGSHGAGPSWTYKDGSGVTAKVLQKVDAENKASAPWLLLEVTAHKGEGLLSLTRYIQRINTQGGVAPESGCDPNHLGAEKKVPYSADYVFFSK